jgi:hypothetical protein
MWANANLMQSFRNRAFSSAGFQWNFVCALEPSRA